MLRRLALAVVLLAPIAAHAGSIDDTTTVTGNQTIAGSFNSGAQVIDRVGNGGLFYAPGRGASISKNTTVDLNQTIAGEFNSGFQSAEKIANGGKFFAGKRLLLRRD
jgi:hypothetical protein